MRCSSFLRWSLAGFVACGAARAARAAPADASDAGPWFTALSSAFVVVDTSSGDLDGDGKDETVVCYRKDLTSTDQASGIVVLAGKGPQAKPVFHVQLAKVQCEKARISGGRIGVLLPGNKQLTWTYGAEVRFRHEKEASVAARSVTATSTLDDAHGAQKAYDNDLSTSWAEGTAGTGIGQGWTIRFEKPLDVGAIALFCGEGSGTRAFLDRNRLHRGSIETKTEADLGDADSGIDFSSLGIATIGDRIEFSCENKPQITYVNVDKRDVVELSVRIDSVYLGDKKDDTHIAEIEVVPVLDPAQTVDRARVVRKKTDPKAQEPSDATGLDVDVESAAKKLDDGGRSIVPDED